MPRGALGPDHPSAPGFPCTTISVHQYPGAERGCTQTRDEAAGVAR